MTHFSRVKHVKGGKRDGPIKPLASHEMFYDKCAEVLIRCLTDAVSGDLDLLCCSIESEAAALLAWARYVQALRERKKNFPEIGSKPGTKKKPTS